MSVGEKFVDIAFNPLTWFWGISFDRVGDLFMKGAVVQPRTFFLIVPQYCKIYILERPMYWYYHCFVVH